jgi:hypothetical protein
MPAKSEKQQVAARIAHAIKKGKVKPKKGTASAQMAKGMSDKQIKHFMVREQFAEPPGEPGVLSRGAGPSPEAPSQAVNYKGHEIRVYRNSHKTFDAYINGKPRLCRNSPFEAIRDAKKIIDTKGEASIRENDEEDEKTFQHYKTTAEYQIKRQAEINKLNREKTAKEKAAKEKKEKTTSETTTSINIGSQGTSTVPPRPKPKPVPVPPGLRKKKKAPPVHAVRSYTGREEMTVARDRVLQMVTEYEADRDRRRGVQPSPRRNGAGKSLREYGEYGDKPEAGSSTPPTIEQIHNHLKAGHEVALVTATRVTVFDKRHVDYIRADGKGFRLGWPGKKSVYAFANQIKLIQPGMTIKRGR